MARGRANRDCLRCLLVVWRAIRDSFLFAWDAFTQWCLQQEAAQATANPASPAITGRLTSDSEPGL